MFDILLVWVVFGLLLIGARGILFFVFGLAELAKTPLRVYDYLKTNAKKKNLTWWVLFVLGWLVLLSFGLALVVSLAVTS
ncbi:MAG: hypothetical protein N2747_00410 [Chitinophagaceae bacterium]|nr:hypothetical protein [Chitinophagaceae bacterium]